MTKYVAGLLFSSDGSKLALIHKNHGPTAVVGRWNAIGGKRTPGEPGLPGESASAAMSREFTEEAGVAVRCASSRFLACPGWTPFLRLLGKDWSVEFFHAFDTIKLEACRTMESEEVRIFPVSGLPNVVPNLRWIIPMARGHEDDHVWIYEVREAKHR